MGLIFAIPAIIVLFTFKWALRSLRELKLIESMITDPEVLKGNLKEQKPFKVILFIASILLLALFGLTILVFIVNIYRAFS